MQEQHKPQLPFVTGYALQNYFSAEEGILEAKKNHFQYWYVDGSIETELPNTWTDERIDHLLKLIDEHQVKPIFHGNYKVPLASDVPELRQVAIDYVKKEIDISARLKAPVIVHGGVIVEPRLVIKAKKQALENYLDSLTILADYAAKKGTTLYLENLSNYKNYRPFHYIFTHDEEYEFILNSIDLPLFLDVGHANVCEGNPAKMIEKYHRRIIGMSFSNNDSVRDLHLGLDKGTIDFNEIVAVILRCQWKGMIGFETRDRSPASSVQDLTRIYESCREYAIAS